MKGVEQRDVTYLELGGGGVVRGGVVPPDGVHHAGVVHVTCEGHLQCNVSEGFWYRLESIKY